MKLKFKENATSVHTHFSTIESWLKIRTKKKDSICMNCKTSYDLLEGHVGLLMVNGEMNKHICQQCAEYYAKLNSVKDIYKVNKHRKELIKHIEENKLNIELESGRYVVHNRDLSSYSSEELQEAIDISEEFNRELERISKIKISEEDSKIEQYLIDEYDVIQNVEYLKCEEQIEEFFMGYQGECCFDCGQGFYQEFAHKIIKIGKKFYEVTIKAEIYSSKQDRGDRLYWVEGIESVDWHEILKPMPKSKMIVRYEFELSEDRIEELDKFLKSNGYI